MIICIVGPTGVGKTKLSIKLAKLLNGEVINADSTQIYKGLDIATAKITDKEKEGIKHHLFDIKDINDDYSVYQYQQDCRKVISNLQEKSITPIIVGGTGLYIKAALYDYKFEEESNNKYLNYTSDELYNRLIKIDPNTEIHKNNTKRIIRALNYYDNTNKAYSSKEKTDKLLYDVIFIGLTTDRENLYNRINLRVDKMIEHGLLNEARNIYDSKIRSKAVMTPIGYKELFEYFDGNKSLNESIELIKQSSRRYAKRQYTWNNNQINVNWFNVNFDNFNITVEEIYKFILNKLHEKY